VSCRTDKRAEALTAGRPRRGGLVVCLFKRSKRLRVEEIADALVEAIMGYASHDLTSEELFERHAAALAQITVHGELGRISVDEAIRMVDVLEVFDPEVQYQMLPWLHWAFARIKHDPIGPAGRRIVAARGLRMLTECAKSALAEGRLEDAAHYVDSPHADTWQAENLIPDGFWFSSKSEVLRGLGRTDDACAAARQGEQAVRDYLAGHDAAVDSDLRQILTEIAEVLNAQAEQP
jgi:hypothetical protein